MLGLALGAQDYTMCGRLHSVLGIAFAFVFALALGVASGLQSYPGRSRLHWRSDVHSARGIISGLHC